MYDALVYPGGIYNTGCTAPLPRALAVLETMVVPVDDEVRGAQLARILEDRSKRTLGEASGAAFERAPLRDDRRAEGPMFWQEMSLYRLLDRINRSGVALYNSNGWLDLFTRDGFLWHANLTRPRRLHVRPLHHLRMGQSGPDLDIGAEALRWFDYWLKDIDNGIMDEPPIHYYVMGAPEENAWRTTDAWPLPSQRPTPFHLAEGPTGSVSSVNQSCPALSAQPRQRPRTAARGRAGPAGLRSSAHFAAVRRRSPHPRRDHRCRSRPLRHAAAPPATGASSAARFHSRLLRQPSDHSAQPPRRSRPRRRDGDPRHRAGCRRREDRDWTQSPRPQPGGDFRLRSC